VKERHTGDPNLLAQWLSELAPGLPVCSALPSYLASEYTDQTSGFIPMIGYHHVLMIIIAVAIILLCESSLCHMACGMSLTYPSLITSRMFVIITANTGYLFDLFIL
jgi:hypothetical protein